MGWRWRCSGGDTIEPSGSLFFFFGIKMVLCECGCGQETTPGKRFVHGHNRRGDTHTPETTEKIRRRLLGNTNGAGHTVSDGAREKIRQSRLGTKNPMYRKVVSAGTRAAIGTASRIRKRTEESKQKQSIAHRGDKNPAWKGGISKSMYCRLFDRNLKTVVREYFNNRCFISDATTEENGKNLSVHHVGYDKRCLCSSPNWCIFVPLSSSYHQKTNYDRWTWYEYLMCQIALRNPNYYAYHVPVVFYAEPSYNFGYVFEKHRVGKLLHQK